MITPKAAILPLIDQHAEQAAFTWGHRRAAVRAPTSTLRHIARIDERLSANIEGLRLSEHAGDRACMRQLAAQEPGAIFAAAVLGLESGALTSLERLLGLAAQGGNVRSGLLGAFGWCDAQHLRGTVATLLKSSDHFARLVGIAACSMHRVDPGLTRLQQFGEADPGVRARLLRAAGELGKREFVSRFSDSLRDPEPDCQFWAAWTAVLLGDRNEALRLLLSMGIAKGSEAERSLQLALMAMPLCDAHSVLQRLATDPLNIRKLIRGSGNAGDPRYVGWLMAQMVDSKLARLSGEAFSLITGVNLTAQNLRSRQPENFQSGPNDDPNDPNVDMDEDDGLPWPDANKIRAWWHANSHRFQPGTRYFMGQPLNTDNCLRVLKEGFQRQRIAAALYLSLLNPGTPLFEWRAPARRQQRLLAAMN